MSNAARRSAIVLSLLTICALPIAMATGVSAEESAPVTTVQDETTRTTPAPTTPAPTTPDTGPEIGPQDSTPETSMPTDPLIAAGDPDADINATAAAIAVVGFVLLVGLASWWMVRRNDPDAAPMPRPSGEARPPSDLI